MSSNELDGIEERLVDIERQLAMPDDELVVVDRDELARIPAHIEMYRAALALNTGDPAGTITHAERTLALAADDNHLSRAAASALSGLASWTTGDLDAAHRGYTVAIEGLHRAGRIADVLGCSITLADLEMTLGRLDAAQRANKIWKRMLADYEAPSIDPGIDEALLEFIARRKASMPDSEV